MHVVNPKASIVDRTFRDRYSTKHGCSILLRRIYYDDTERIEESNNFSMTELLSRSGK